MRIELLLKSLTGLESLADATATSGLMSSAGSILRRAFARNTKMKREVKNMGEYKIMRYSRDKPPRTIIVSLTLEEAQRHCSDRSTHKIDKEGNVLWFDGYTKE
jgi:hypothetical protein